MANLISIVIGIIVFCAWVTHIVYCFTTHAWLLLLAGAVLFPIGIVHGFGLWFGFWR